MQSLQYKMSYQQSLVTFTSRQSARENAELFSRKQIRTTGGKIFSYSLVWHHNDYIEKSDRQTQWPWPVFLELLKRKQIFSGSISKYWQEQRWFLELLGVRDDFGVGIDFRHDIDKGSLPIEKVPNFREFSLLWSNPPPLELGKIKWKWKKFSLHFSTN